MRDGVMPDKITIRTSADGRVGVQVAVGGSLVAAFALTSDLAKALGTALLSVRRGEVTVIYPEADQHKGDDKP